MWFVWLAVNRIKNNPREWTVRQRMKPNQIHTHTLHIEFRLIPFIYNLFLNQQSGFGYTFFSELKVHFYALVGSKRVLALPKRLCKRASSLRLHINFTPPPSMIQLSGIALRFRNDPSNHRSLSIMWNVLVSFALKLKAFQNR